MFDSLIILLVVVVMVRGAYTLAVQRNAEKLHYGVPWLQWLTFEEIVALGHRRFWTRILLPAFYRAGYIEIRIHARTSEADRARAEEQGLRIGTVELYEYKFTEHWKRGKKRPTTRPPKFQLMPV